MKIFFHCSFSTRPYRTTPAIIIPQGCLVGRKRTIDSSVPEERLVKMRQFEMHPTNGVYLYL